MRFGVFEDRLEIIVADQGDSFDFDQKQQDLGSTHLRTQSINCQKEGSVCI